MHYPQNFTNDFARDPSKPIITPKVDTNGAILGQRDGLSPGDIIKIRLLYQCEQFARSLSDYERTLCSKDCKCWEGAIGCDKDGDDACQGDLKCIDNACVETADDGCVVRSVSWGLRFYDNGFCSQLCCVLSLKGLFGHRR